MTKPSKKTTDALAKAREVLQIEAEAILALRDRIGPEFEEVVALVLSCRGKVLATGVGKSGIVARKLAGTLSSTGTPAVFLDPVAAAHGDLGAVSKGDVLIAISNSGEATEVLNVVAASARRGAQVVAITGRGDSTLASRSSLALDAGVAREACPLGLAPTASTTAAMAIGDALAMVVMTRRGFQEQDYAALHPAGDLGERLSRRVLDLMRTGDRLPVVKESDTFADALNEMTQRDNLGVTLVVNGRGALTGIITDGDLRRLFRQEKLEALHTQKVARLMKRNPRTIDLDATAKEALRLMESGKGQITSLAIVDSASRPIGIVHLHDILGRQEFMV